MAAAVPLARRRLFAALGLPALLASPLPTGRPAAPVPLAGPPPAPSLAPKIALAMADLRAARADLDGIEARFADLPDDSDDPDRVAAEAALDTADARFCDAVCDLAEAPAATFADLLAKAEALRLALLSGAFQQIGTPPEQQGEAHDRLAWAVAHDILALTPPADRQAAFKGEFDV